MMRQSNFLSLFLAAAAAFPAAAVDATVLNLIGPDAAVVAGVDFDKLRESPFGKYALTRANVSQADLEKVRQMLGFDPMKDLREVVIASPDPNVRSAGILFVRGSFDHSKLIGLAGLQGATIDSYQGYRLLAPPTSSKAEPMAALLPAGIALGTETALKAALDRAAKGQPPDRDLTARINQASAGKDAWILMLMSPSRFAPQLKDRAAPRASGGPSIDKVLNGNLIQGIEDLAAGLQFGANVIFSGQATARSDQDAAAIGDVLKFLSSMAASNTSANTPPALVSLLGSLQTSTEGRTFKFSMSAPQSDLENLLKEQPRVRTRPVVQKQ